MEAKPKTDQESSAGGDDGGRAPNPRLTVVIVTWRSAEFVAESLAALDLELRPADELIVIDNASDDGSADIVARATDRARIVRNVENVGFVSAVNEGARMAAGDLLVLLNPDAAVRPGWRDAIERPWTQGYGWGAWQALITSDSGRSINSDGNQIHFTGICWAGGAGRPVEEAPDEPGEVGYPSGACMAVPLDVWRELGGFSERLFMYGDDVDLGLRIRLSGRAVGIEPSARVEHDYEFDKGSAKWRYLERSRWAFIVRTYPGALLVRLAPALVVTELAVVLAALRGGWLRAKAGAVWDLSG